MKNSIFNAVCKTRYLALLTVLTLLLTLGAGNAWATVAQYTFSDKNFTSSPSGWTKDVAGYGYNATNGGIQCTNSARGKAHTTASVTNVSTVIVIYSSNGTSGSIKVTVGTNDTQTFNIANVGNGADASAVFDFLTPQTGNVYVQGYSTGSNIYIRGVVIISGTLGCNNIAVSSTPIILPNGSETYAAGAWYDQGVTASGYGYADLYETGSGSNDYCVIAGYGYDKNKSADGMQFKAYAGLLILHGITSAGGVSVEIKYKSLNSSKGFSVDLTGASTQNNQYSGTTTISTNSTNATLVIRKVKDGALYLKTIKITPLCTPPATDLAITNATATVTIGNTLTMTTNTGSGGGNGGTVSWSVTSGTGSASINSSTGVLTPSSAGTVTVKAHQDKNGDVCPQDAEKVITIEAAVVPVSSVSVDPTSKKIFIGETFTVTPTVLPANATNKNVNWSSSATAKATVTSAGLVTGVATGSANITATSAADGTKSATCAVTVYSITCQVKDEAGNTLSGSGMPTASALGRAITASASGNNYVFKEWQAVTAAGTTISSTSSTSTTLTGTPTGNVTVKAVYYAPCSVTWKVNGSDYTTGGPTTSVAHGSHVTTLPTAPSTATYCGDVFVGWTDAAGGAYVHGTSNLYTTASGFPDATGNQIFYAVFADYAD